MAVASLVLGIISIIFCFFPGFNFVAPITGIIGIVLGAISRKKLMEAREETGMATGGLVTSIVGTALGMVIWVACAACAGSATMCAHGLNEAVKDPNFKKDLERSIKQFEKNQNRNPNR